MSRYKIILIPIAVLFAILTAATFINFKSDWKEYNEQLYLDTVVNYCVDAAVEEMIKVSSDLDTDYISKEYSRVDPNVALDTFCEMFCESLGYSINSENITLVRNDYLKGFAVVAYDGLYLAEPVVTGDGGIELVFRNKMPFEYNGYLLNLENKTCSYWDTATGKVAVVESMVSMQKLRQVVNELVTDEFMGSIFRNTEGAVSTAFFVPTDMSNIVRTNPIEGISVLAYVKGVQVNSVNTLDSFAIGGSRMVPTDYIAGYERDGVKYYIESSKLQGDEGSITVFNSNVEAAEAGYMYDITRFN